MSNESIVYWALPNEVVALKNTKKNMVTNNLIKTRLILEKILDNINPGDKVAIKVHVGEGYNTRYLRHDYVHEVVDFVKSLGGIPTLIETMGLGMKVQHIKMSDEHVICMGVRKTESEHENIAQLHGYSESTIGAPLKFIDGEKGIDGKIIKIDGIHFKDVSVGKGLFDFDKMIVIAHFKGHGQAAFGGALKQLGIGCVTKRNKFRAHFDGIQINPKKCANADCDKICLEVCPVGAIKYNSDTLMIDDSCVGCMACNDYCKVKRAINSNWRNVPDFVDRFIDNAKGVITGFGPENIRYINFALDVVLNCDCASNPGPPIVPDLGIFGSVDPVAVDKACVDAETAAPGVPKMDKDGKWVDSLGPGIEKFHTLMPLSDTSFQFNAAVKNKIGNLNYKLVKI